LERPILFKSTNDVPEFERMLLWITTHEEFLSYLYHKEYQHLFEDGGTKLDEYYREIELLRTLYEGDVIALREAIDRHYPGRSLNPVGRPKIGVRRQVKMTLPAEDWYQIEASVLSGSASSIADYFRQLHESAKHS